MIYLRLRNVPSSRTLRQRRGACIVAVLGLASAGFAQDWTAEQLDQACEGFHQPGLAPRLTQIAALRQQPAARPAIIARIHGDHREYRLKVEQLIDQLADERWLEREQAEKTLIEIGGRASDMLERHARSGQLLEQRLRCARILQRLKAKDTKQEQQNLETLRGLVATAAYLQPDDSLREALRSVLEHSDPEIRIAAAHALGVHGVERDAPLLRALLEESDLRAAALTGLLQLPGAEALASCAELLRSGGPASEAIAVVRGLRRRSDAAALLADLRQNGSPEVAMAAGIAMPAPSAPPEVVQVVLDDQTVLKAEILGMTADQLIVSSPIEGLPDVRVPLEECDAIEVGPTGTPESGSVRLFLTSGSLVVGMLVALHEGHLTIEAQAFGEVRIPRQAVQGIAFDARVDRMIDASPTTDRLRLKTGQGVDGDCVRIADGRVTLTTENGESTFALADLSGILFRRPAVPAVDQESYARIDLTAGHRLLAHIVEIRGGALAVVVPQLGAAVIALHDVVRIVPGVAGGAVWGFMLVADYADNRVIEFDDRGQEIFAMDQIFGAWDAECLANGNLLLTEFLVSRVVEMTRSGEIVWAFEDLRNPYDADRLPNGNTLIADTFRGRVIEVDPAGKIVWEYAQGIRPFDVERLPRGNTLIADVLKDRVIEVEPGGKIVWERGDLPNVHDADRLPNGNTLVALRTAGRVLEFDPTGKEVWRLTDLHSPSDADRLANGHTLVAENGMVREFDRRGQVVWKRAVTWAVEVNRY